MAAGQIHIVAECPKCFTEAHLKHPIDDGEVLLTPPFWILQCENPYCRHLFRVTLRVDVETWPPHHAGTTAIPLRLAAESR